MSRAVNRKESNEEKVFEVKEFKLLPFASFQKIFGVVWPPVTEVLSVPSALMIDLLKIAISKVPIDERFYLAKYPDIADAISLGKFTSAKHHYEMFGFFEGRQPYEITVDEDYYLQENSDIAQSIKLGTNLTAQSHFERYGLKEGRLPNKNFSLLVSNVE